MTRGNSLFDNAALLAIIGILAGALGGLAIGLVTNKTPAVKSATSTNR